MNTKNNTRKAVEIWYKNREIQDKLKHYDNKLLISSKLNENYIIICYKMQNLENELENNLYQLESYLKEFNRKQWLYYLNETYLKPTEIRNTKGRIKDKT